MEQRLSISLQPKQRLALDTTERVTYTLFGGAKGGGKSYLLRAREVWRRLKYPGSKGLIVRKTFPELLANHIRPFFKEYPIVREWYNKQEKTIYWPNGSTTEFSYLRATDDVYTYQGREYDDISIDEATQHEEEVFRTLASSMRTTDPAMKPSLLLTGNPGGIGHQWVKRLFIDRRFIGKEKTEDYAFVPAFVQDNDALMEANPTYVDVLENLPEHLKRMYLYGDWNVFAGLAFSELQQRIHVIKPVSLPAYTKYFAGFDYGYEHPYAFVLFALFDEQIHVINYVSEQHRRPDQIGEKIKTVVPATSISAFCGTDIWDKDGRSSIFEQLNQALAGTVILNRAYTDRKQGVAQIRKAIAWEGTATGKPQLYFWENCLPVFNVVQSMQFDPNDPEDVLKQDADNYGFNGDDLYDAFRYGIMGYVHPLNKPIKSVVGTGQEIINMIQTQQLANNALKGWR